MIKNDVLKNMKAAIFDMDGTLVDSMLFWDQVDIDFLAKRGIQCTEEIHAYFRTCSLQMAAECFSKEFGIPGTIPEIMEMINQEMETAYREKIEPKEGAKELLEALKAKGIPMVIATSTDRYLVEMLLKRLGFLEYFDRIYTCTEVGKNKSHPDIFFEALKLLGTKPEETPVFEDCLYSMETAKKNGFPVAAVYDLSSQADNEAIQDIADVYVKTPGEWLEYM